METAPQFRIRDTTGTITVYTRNHINGCKLTDPNHNNCPCPKWIYANRKGHAPKRCAAETPSFAEACQKAKHIHDGWHPEVAEARALKVTRNRTQRPIGDVVNDFIHAKLADNIATTTVEQYKSLIGYRNEDGTERGHLLKWLDTRNAGLAEEDRINYIDQLDVQLVSQFKTWLMQRFSSDATRNQAWTVVRCFFRWVFHHGITQSNVVESIKAPVVTKGNRCGAWTDQQYEDLLASVSYLDESIAGRSNTTRTVIKRRLFLFIELMRYTGMALVDTVLFCPFIDNHGLGLSESGVLRYRRKKTNELAVIPIENKKLLAAIKAGIPLEADSDPRRPFAPRGLDPRSKSGVAAAVKRWTDRLQHCYAAAGITEIVTEVGKRKPHAHMFRDTFAKWHLDRGTDIRDLQKMMGHSSVVTTERCYSSWMKQDQEAMIARVVARTAPSNIVSMPRKRFATAGR